MSPVIEEVAGVHDNALKHATTEYAQTIGLLERSHASIKQALEIETGEWRSFSHKYVSIAVLNYNTSYHTSIGCEPSRAFHGHIPYIFLDLKLKIRPQQEPIPTLQVAQDVLDETGSTKMFAKKPCRLKSNTKFITTEKANASKLKKANYV